MKLSTNCFHRPSKQSANEPTKRGRDVRLLGRPPSHFSILIPHFDWVFELERPAFEISLRMSTSILLMLSPRSVSVSISISVFVALSHFSCDSFSISVQVSLINLHIWKNTFAAGVDWSQKRKTHETWPDRLTEALFLLFYCCYICIYRLTFSILTRDLSLRLTNDNCASSKGIKNFKWPTIA